MKKLITALVALALMVAGCSKLGDEINPASRQEDELKSPQQPVPFNGTVTGFITTTQGDCETPWIGRHFEGTGNALHMGNIEMILDYCILYTIPNPGPETDGTIDGPGSIIAANGDIIYGHFIGTFTLVDWTGSVPAKSIINATGILTGGTGRFEGVTGVIYGTAEMDLTGGEPIPTTLDWTGTIQYGMELLEGNVTGYAASSTPTCPGANSWTFSGNGNVVPLGAVTSTETYCAYATYLYLNPSVQNGGTMSGNGILVQTPNGDELYSEFTGSYSFFVMGASPIVNAAIGTGTITGGTGEYAGATGTYILLGKQSMTSYPLYSDFYFVGWIDR